MTSSYENGMATTKAIEQSSGDEGLLSGFIRKIWHLDQHGYMPQEVDTHFNQAKHRI